MNLETEDLSSGLYKMGEYGRCFRFILIPFLLFFKTGCCESFENAAICYWISTEAMSFEDARQSCTDMGGILVQMDSEDTFELVRRKMVDKGDFWVGLTRTNQGFLWNNTKEPSREQWMPGEPNYTGSCTRIIQVYGGKDYGKHYLADYYCTEKFNYICQKLYTFDEYNIGRGASENALALGYCPMTSYEDVGTLSCARECTVTLACVGFTYNRTLSRCTLYQMSFRCNVDVSNTVVTAVQRQCNWT